MSYKQEFLEGVFRHFPKLNVISEYKGIGHKVLVEDEYGNQFLVFPRPLASGIYPSIQTSLDKNKYFAYLSNSVHKNKYDYSKVSYLSARKKVTITCSKHGDFQQTLNNHYNFKQGCPDCGHESTANKRRKDVAVFVREANDVHLGKYSYENSKYINDGSKLSITCKIHGDFQQRPNDHLFGQGCPKCYIPIGTNLKKWLSFCEERNRSTCTLYVIRCFNDSEEFVKIGITSRAINERFNHRMPYSFEIIKEIKGSPDFIWNKEKEYHRLFKSKKYIPKIKFEGHTECFDVSII